MYTIGPVNYGPPKNSTLQSRFGGKLDLSGFVLVTELQC